MTDLENFVAMLEKSRTSHQVQTKFATEEEGEDDEGYSLPERFFTESATRVTMHGGSGMHAEAEFDAAGNLLGIGRMEHY